MKKFLRHVRARVTAGLVFLIPLFAVILILQKLWTALSGAGSYISKLLGLPAVLGKSSVTIATAVLLALLFYFCGWLVKFRSLNIWRDWIETKVLQFIPGYLTYKAQVQEKITPKQDNRIPVWVTTDGGKRPGLLIEEKQGSAIVFFPNSPDSNNGQVLMVGRNQLTRLDIAAGTFLKSIQKFGRDLPGVIPDITSEEKKMQSTTTMQIITQS